jgi:hypothetical protein
MSFNLALKILNSGWVMAPGLQVNLFFKTRNRGCDIGGYKEYSTV